MSETPVRQLPPITKSEVDQLIVLHNYHVKGPMVTCIWSRQHCAMLEARGYAKRVPGQAETSTFPDVWEITEEGVKVAEEVFAKRLQAHKAGVAVSPACAPGADSG